MVKSLSLSERLFYYHSNCFRCYGIDGQSLSSKKKECRKLRQKNIKNFNVTSVLKMLITCIHKGLFTEVTSKYIVNYQTGGCVTTFPSYSN